MIRMTTHETHHRLGACRSPSGDDGVGVVVKRTLSYGKIPSDSEIVVEPRHEGDLLEEDSDLWAPHKPCTDVVVRGTIRAGGPARTTIASVCAAGVTKRVRVHAERRVSVSRGTVHIDYADSLRETTLSYVQAYGGALPVAESRRSWGRSRGEEVGVSYPRNPAGRGFTTRDRLSSLDGALAPSQEDPDDPVTPDRLVRAGAEDWISAPVPASFGPVGYDWFPRSHFLMPGLSAQDLARPREIGLGLLRAEDIGDGATSPDPRWLSSASPGLALPPLSGVHGFTLEGFRWGGGAVHLEIDATAPRVGLRFPSAGSYPVELKLATVAIDADRETVSLVWGGFQATSLPYPEDQLADVGLEIRRR
jgi:hypothetical protein